MDISFEGYAENAVTFYADSDVLPGDPVMIGEEATVYKAEAGADIIGVALAVKDGYATVKTSGTVTLPSSGLLMPGYTKLTVDSEGALDTGESGPDRLVIYVDSAAGTATVLL